MYKGPPTLAVIGVFSMKTALLLSMCGVLISSCSGDARKLNTQKDSVGDSIFAGTIHYFEYAYFKTKNKEIFALRLMTPNAQADYAKSMRGADRGNEICVNMTISAVENGFSGHPPRRTLEVHKVISAKRVDCGK
jgi:hypothetical protein